jgi:cysteinyl-tRNA synthetase
MTLRTLTTVLGLALSSPRAASAEVGRFVDLLVEVRGAARAKQDGVLSDHIRDRLNDLGIAVEYASPGETTWRWRL